MKNSGISIGKLQSRQCMQRLKRRYWWRCRGTKF